MRRPYKRWSSRGFIASLNVNARSDISELRKSTETSAFSIASARSKSSYREKASMGGSPVLTDMIEQRRQHYKELDRL